MSRTTTVHEAAVGYHDGELAACLECNGISFYYQVRVPAAAIHHASTRLILDTENEEQAFEVAESERAAFVVREVWQEQGDELVQLRTERLRRVGRWSDEHQRVVAVVEVAED